MFSVDLIAILLLGVMLRPISRKKETMNAPLLEENKCSILIAVYATGHVFKKDLTLFLKGDNEKDVFQPFDNLNTAKEFVISFIKNRPDLECSIYNYNGDYLTIYDIDGEWKFAKD